MKSIYILLTRPTTVISKVIHSTTKDEFTHISISFNEELVPLYSFSRKFAPSPLPAGMTSEAIDMGFYKNRGYINCALYKLEVPSPIYEEAKRNTELMFENSQAYRFNILGLALCRLNIPLDRDRHYFCSQFVSQILETSGALNMPKPWGLMRPADFMMMPRLQLIFQGNLTSLRQYISPFPCEEFHMAGRII